MSKWNKWAIHKIKAWKLFVWVRVQTEIEPVEDIYWGIYCKEVVQVIVGAGSASLEPMELAVKKDWNSWAPAKANVHR